MLIKMAIKFCPRCRRRYTPQPYDVDFVHTCDSGDETLDYEDVQKLATYVDVSGNTIKVLHPFRQGIVNPDFGTDLWIYKEESVSVTPRGNRTATHRVRRHEEYIDLEEDA